MEYSNGIRRNQRVEYEWVPQKCEICHMFGHTGGNCSVKMAYVAKPTNPSGNNEDTWEVIEKRPSSMDKGKGTMKETQTETVGMPQNKGIVIRDQEDISTKVVEEPDSIVTRINITPAPNTKDTGDLMLTGNKYEGLAQLEVHQLEVQIPTGEKTANQDQENKGSRRRGGRRKGRRKLKL